jgi:hypothetical protein
VLKRVEHLLDTGIHLGRWRILALAGLPRRGFRLSTVTVCAPGKRNQRQSHALQ